MITEEIGYKMDVLEDGQIQVCRVTHVMKDGVEIAMTLHRHVLAPGDELKDQHEKVATVAAAVWSEKVISYFTEAKQAREAQMTPK